MRLFARVIYYETTLFVNFVFECQWGFERASSNRTGRHPTSDPQTLFRSFQIRDKDPILSLIDHFWFGFATEENTRSQFIFFLRCNFVYFFLQFEVSGIFKMNHVWNVLGTLIVQLVTRNISEREIFNIHTYDIIRGL